MLFPIHSTLFQVKRRDRCLVITVLNTMGILRSLQQKCHVSGFKTAHLGLEQGKEFWCTSLELGSEYHWVIRRATPFCLYWRTASIAKKLSAPPSPPPHKLSLIQTAQFQHLYSSSVLLSFLFPLWKKSSDCFCCCFKQGIWWKTPKQKDFFLLKSFTNYLVLWSHLLHYAGF